MAVGILAAGASFSEGAIRLRGRCVEATTSAGRDVAVAARSVSVGSTGVVWHALSVHSIVKMMTSQLTPQEWAGRLFLMRSLRIIGIILTIIALIVGGCTNTSDVNSQQLPTVAQLPTATTTFTPTITDTPSDTPTATFTPSATSTASSTATNTPLPTNTASLTFTPSYTFTPTFSPTFTFTPSSTPSDTPTLTPSITLRPTLTPSPTKTNTPPPTLTPLPTLTNTPLPTATFTPTPAGPTIYAFGANYQSVLPNTQLTFAFSSDADGARIEASNQNGAVFQVFPVFPTGNYSVIVPDNQGRLLTYRFVAMRAGLEDSRTIQVSVTCPVSWFFGDQYAPPNAACPTVLGATGDGRYQSFEHGVMIYVNANGMNRVYGLQDTNSLYISYPNGWDGSTINSSAPPSGRFIPAQMFNYIYYSTLAPIGSWNSSIGWGTTDINSDPRTIQWEGAPGGGGAFYIDAPGGAVYRFSGGDSGSWGRLR